ncbi:MAG: branched-chain amino acid aminotransferase [Candidatus Falkowbacteria bacterium]
MDIATEKVPEKDLKPLPDESSLGFGRYFTDHMFTMKWNEPDKWHGAAITPSRDLAISPAGMMLHYAQGIFEGLKAYYRGPDKFALFRHKDNISRFNASARRLEMPTIHPAVFQQAMLELIKTDIRWIPRSPGSSLYIRPFMIATEPGLGVRVAKEYLFGMILSPVGAYFASGFKPSRIYVEEKMSRVPAGGLGDIKASANYAGSLPASQKAKNAGYDQVLWLDAKEHRFVEEVGAMNIFFACREKALFTPRLNGNILPGITRDSVLKLADSLGLAAIEAYFDINDIISQIKSGEITEIFGSGTAAVIAPVGELYYQRKKFVLDNKKAGPVTERLYDILVSMQYGKYPDLFGWVEEIKL